MAHGQGGAEIVRDGSPSLTCNHEAPIAFTQEQEPKWEGGNNLAHTLGTYNGRKQAVAFSCKDHGADAGETCPTLRGLNEVDGNANGGGQVAVMTLAVRGRGDGSDLEYRQDGTSNAVLTPSGGRAGIGVGAAAIPYDLFQITAPLNRQNRDEKSPCHMLAKDNAAHAAIASTMSVRRLTPVECERLQGFPDDYTAIAYRSKPAADGPRDKALGNSMAVPVVRWIGQRIQVWMTTRKRGGK